MNEVNRLWAALLSVALIVSVGVGMSPPAQAAPTCESPFDNQGNFVDVVALGCAPNAPENARAEYNPAGIQYAATVTWSPPSQNPHLVDHYVVTGWLNDATLTTPKDTYCSRVIETTCTIEGLGIGRYQFWVTAVTEKGSETGTIANVIEFPQAAEPPKPKTKYERYVELATSNLQILRDGENGEDLELGYRLYTDPAGLKLQAKNGRAVCRYLKRSKKGGISGREIRNARDIIWGKFREDIDYMTGRGVALDDIRGVMQMSDASLGTAVYIYCPKYTSLYFDRISPSLVSKYERYVG